MQLNRYSLMYLEWMFENQPERVKELYETYRLVELEELLEAKNQEGLAVVQKMLKAGKSQREALALAAELVWAPAEGARELEDPPPTPVPQKVREHIHKWLEDRPEDPADM